MLSNDKGYNVTVSVRTKDNCELVLKSKNYYKEDNSRSEWYDPQSPYYGKNVRQVYYVHL